MALDVANLKSSFPTLEDLRVTGFRDQDWCRFIDYPRGAFTTKPDGSDAGACNLFSGPALPFDHQAEADFQTVRRALSDAGMRGKWVTWVQFDAGGRIKSAQFDVNGGAFDRWTYVFDRGGPMPESMPAEEVYTPINDDWYFWWEDWN